MLGSKLRAVSIVGLALALGPVHAGQAAIEKRALGVIGQLPAPALAYRHVIHDDGDTWDSDSFVSRLTVINFWATWCPPCIEELPLLQGFFEAYGEREVRVVGVTKLFRVADGSMSEQVELEEIRHVLEEGGVTFPNLIAEDDQAWSDYHASGVPVTILVGTDGRPVAFGTGIKGTKRVLRSARKRLDE